MSRKISISFPELALFGATRGMLGAGLGMLATRGLSRETRKSIGLPLFIAGAVSTIPFAIHFLKERRAELENGQNETA